MTDKPIIVDQIELICDGCQGVRVFRINPHLRGAEELRAWLQTQPKQCTNCNAATCTVKCRLVDPS